MPPLNWQRIDEAFDAALDLPPEKRSAWLEKHYGQETEMRREIESLLAAEAASPDFLPRAGFARAAGLLLSEAVETHEGRRVGRYHILREIGRGGMGIVFLAEREDEEFNQRVAVKLIKGGLDTEDILRRFLNERQILASLNHPNIAKLFDGGTTEDGHPYFVMEYIEGLPLLQYCDRQGLSTQERLRLFQNVCAAVQHAHQNLVIHRDIKPSNILVTDEGEVKLLDFGVAKFLKPELSGEIVTATQTALRVMTPEYASPEQVRGEHLTTATDIYSLGVVLYELLTGARPYKLKDASPAELSRAICDSEPSKPSEAVADSKNLSSGLQSEIGNRKLLRGDIDNIVLMALRKEATRRYKSAEQFAEDIRRHLEGLPVIARKDTFAYRASKFIGRNRIGVTAAAVVALAIIAGLIGTIWQARVARQERDRAQAQQAKAERINKFLTTALSFSNPYAAAPGSENRRDATINQMLDDVAPRIESELADQPEVRASLERTIGAAYYAQTRLAEAERFLNAALETQLKLYGEDHMETARTLHQLALVMMIKGDLAISEKYLQRAIAIFRSQQQKGQADVKSMAESLTLYGDILWSKGDYKAADVAYSEGIMLASQLSGSERAFLAAAKTGLGANRYALGNLDEAESLLRESVAEYRNLPKSRLDVAATLNPLAQVLIWEKKYDEALSLVRESESITGPLLGEDNYYFARSLLFEAYALALKGEYTEAERVADKLEVIIDRNFAGDKITKANLYDTRALILARSGRAAQGEKFGQLATQMYQSVMSRGANSIAIARMHWAESLKAQKKYEEAEKVLLEAYKDSSEVNGAQHWRAKDVERELAKLYEAWNKRSKL
ncbi:MAG TPA: serine/threonine-protein kinase [Pyrinomonadaceae bacterium]|nr:serine/threonine-protein kinase [Pyrinomonadaceae bacterium]